jgi:hypothetical protein
MQIRDFPADRNRGSTVAATRQNSGIDFDNSSRSSGTSFLSATLSKPNPCQNVIADHNAQVAMKSLQCNSFSTSSSSDIMGSVPAEISNANTVRKTDFNATPILNVRPTSVECVMVDEDVRGRMQEFRYHDPQTQRPANKTEVERNMVYLPGKQEENCDGKRTTGRNTVHGHCADQGGQQILNVPGQREDNSNRQRCTDDALTDYWVNQVEMYHGKKRPASDPIPTHNSLTSRAKAKFPPGFLEPLIGNWVPGFLEPLRSSQAKTGQALDQQGCSQDKLDDTSDTVHQGIGNGPVESISSRFAQSPEGADCSEKPSSHFYPIPQVSACQHGQSKETNTTVDLLKNASCPSESQMDFLMNQSSSGVRESALLTSKSEVQEFPNQSLSQTHPRRVQQESYVSGDIPVVGPASNQSVRLIPNESSSEAQSSSSQLCSQRLRPLFRPPFIVTEHRKVNQP